MEYVVVFLAGAVAAASALLIGYFRTVSLLRAEQRRVKSWDVQLKAESADLRTTGLEYLSKDNPNWTEQ